MCECVFVSVSNWGLMCVNVRVALGQASKMPLSPRPVPAPVIVGVYYEYVSEADKGTALEAVAATT